MAEGFDGAGLVRGTRDAAEAADATAELLRDGDTVLVKASRGVGLEAVAERLGHRRGGAA